MAIARFPFPNGWLPYAQELRGYANPFRLWEYCWAFWETCGPSQFLRVGDFGSGGTGYAQFLRSHNERVAVIDPTLNLEKCGDFETHKCKAHEYKGEPFDIIVCISVLEHMTDEELYLFANVLPKFLKPGGCAAFTCDLHLNKLEGQGGEKFGENRSYKKFIERTGLSLRPLQEPIPGFEGFSIDRLNSDSSVLVSNWCGVPLTSQGFILEKPMNDLYGILLTMNEVDVIEQWCEEHLHYFKDVVVIDNSTDGTREHLQQQSNIIVLKQEELTNELAYDNIRQFGLSELRQMGLKSRDWVHLCHADEFLTCDPNVIVSIACAYGVYNIYWNTITFIPTESEGQRCFNESLSVHERFHYWIPQWSEKMEVFHEYRTFQVGPDTCFTKIWPIMPGPESYYRFGKHLHFYPTFKHFGWRSAKHASHKRDWRKRKEGPRPKDRRFGSNMWEINKNEDLYQIVKSINENPRLFNAEDFKLPQWHSQRWFN